VPAFTGAFASLNYSYELQDPGIHDVGYQIAIQQDGIVYTPYNPEVQDAVDTRKTWKTAPNPYFLTGLTASQFCAINTTSDCSSHPDFGPGTTTVFGYAVENSFIGTGSGTYESGIDNWCVVLVGAVGTGSSGHPGCGGVTN
jgi:hypothetical protein